MTLDLGVFRWGGKDHLGAILPSEFDIDMAASKLEALGQQTPNPTQSPRPTGVFRAHATWSVPLQVSRWLPGLLGHADDLSNGCAQQGIEPRGEA